MNVSSKFLWLAGLEENTLDEIRQFLAGARQVDQQEAVSDSKLASGVFGTLGVVREQLCRRKRWRELADECWTSGRLLTACSYELRNMRLAGSDTDGKLTQVTEKLTQLGFNHVVEAAQATYEELPASQQIDQGLDVLQRAFKSHRENPLPTDAERIEQRTEQVPRVSLIVSMYNAEPKLEFFLRRVAKQTLHQRGQLELILVDSKSPTNERAVVDRLGPELNLSYVYLRTADREPIALAWNRGLALAKARHVAFWGVDEGGSEDALETLSQFLDDNPTVDWVQSDAVSFDLADDGTILRQTRSYDRSGLSTEMIYLNHQYLTYVGGMYRRDIHDRVGYYSSDFRAAGDTEFKLRSLPHIKVAHVAKPLGEYLNYQEERLTEHPRAEIEDVLAHELHHSPAGVAYAFPEPDAERLWQLLEMALKFRPCIQQFWATDLDYAVSIARYMEVQGILPPQHQKIIRRLDDCLTQYRRLDEPGARWAQLSRVGWASWRLQKLFRRVTDGRFQPALWLFNDARYSRYYRPWRSSLESPIATWPCHKCM